MTAIQTPPTGVVASTLGAASGRHHRDDPVLVRTGGPAGNAVLTAWTGLVLLVLFVAELLTLFNVRGLITWHVAIGALLVPPALLKTGVTTWRMVRFYRGDADYHQAGPPPVVFRMLGPLVVLSTLGLLATGGLLVVLGPQTSQQVLVTTPLLQVSWVTLHQADFAVWASVTALHLLGRLVPALLLVTRRAGRRIPGASLRHLVAAAVLTSAVSLSVLVVHATGDWKHDGPEVQPGNSSGPPRP